MSHSSTDTSKKIAVVGLGYVGLPLALLAAQKEYDVIGVDIDKEKVENLKNNIAPFVDVHISDQLHDAADDISFTTDWNTIQDAEIVVLCVPTPVDERYIPDLQPIQNAAENLGSHLQEGALVILESTVNPGITQEILQPILERTSGLKGGVGFELSHCPERINPGDEKWTVRNIPRVVGSLTETGKERTKQFYESILDADVTPMNSIKEAEAVKVVENAFRDINIAFVNELAQSFSKLGIDVVNVIDGASSKPFAFMAHYPGCGVGGHCIPVDPYYLIKVAKENGFEHRFLSLARSINNDMPRYTTTLLMEKLHEQERDIQNTTVLVLGIAYKANIDDDRESPSYDIQEQLLRLGAKVEMFDPHVPSKSSVTSLEDGLAKANAMIVATAHDEFRSLSPDLLDHHDINVVVDGRNCLQAETFKNSRVQYVGIGRPTQHTDESHITSGLYEHTHSHS